MQYLSAESEARQLTEQPSDIPIVSYHLPSPPQGSHELDTSNVGANLNRKTTDLQKLITVFNMFGRACNGLMANESVLAAVKVRRSLLHARVFVALRAGKPIVLRACITVKLPADARWGEAGMPGYVFGGAYQELRPALLIGVPMNPCTQVLAAALDVPYVGFFPGGEQSFLVPVFRR